MMATSISKVFHPRKMTNRSSVNSLIHLTLPEAVSEESLAAFVQILPFETLSFSSKRADGAFSGAWQLLWVVEGSPECEATLKGINSALGIMQLDAVSAHDLTISPLDEEINWLEVSYQGFEPFSAGRFFIHGAHFDGSIPDGQISLEIDASIAFGSTLSVAGLISTTTGTKPIWINGQTEVDQDRAGTITSSPDFKASRASGLASAATASRLADEPELDITLLPWP